MWYLQVICTFFLALTGIPGQREKFLYQLARENKLFHLFFNPNNRFSGKWHITFPFTFSKYRTCSTICWNILTENFSQMVSAPWVAFTKFFWTASIVITLLENGPFTTDISLNVFNLVNDAKCYVKVTTGMTINWILLTFDSPGFHPSSMNNFHTGILEGASASSFFLILCFFFALSDNWGCVLTIYVTSVVHFSLWYSSLVVWWDKIADNPMFDFCYRLVSADAIVYILHENTRLLTEGIKLIVQIHLGS